MWYFTQPCVVHSSLSSSILKLCKASRARSSLAILLWGYRTWPQLKSHTALPCWVNLVFPGELTWQVLSRPFSLPPLGLKSSNRSSNGTKTMSRSPSDTTLHQEQWLCKASEQLLHLIPVTMAILGCIFSFLTSYLCDAFILSSLWSSKGAGLEGFWEVLGTSRSAGHPGGAREGPFLLVLMGHQELFQGDQSCELENLWGTICPMSLA